MAGNRRKKDKRKKDPNSPDFQNSQPEQKRTTMDMNRSQQQASGSFVYPTYTQAHPQQHMPYSQPYGQPYYGSPPPPPVPMSMSQLPPLPVSPPVSASQGQSQSVLSGDVLAQLFGRLDMMDKKLGQLHSIQSTLQNVTVQVNDVSTRLKSVETKVCDLERSRTFDSKTLDDIKGKQREMDKMLKTLQKSEEEQKKRIIDLQSRQMRDNLIFYNIEDERDESSDTCYGKLVNVLQNELKVERARMLRFDRVHRLGRYEVSKTRPIIAKFCFFQERETVRKSAKNLEGTQYSVGQQFPKEIQAKRKELLPTMKRLKNEGQNAYLSVDKLYVDGKLYKGVIDAPYQQQNGDGARGSGRARGLGRGWGQGRGRGQEWGQGQGHMMGNDQNPGNLQADRNEQRDGFDGANRFSTLQDEGHDGGQGQMDEVEGQGQG